MTREELKEIMPDITDEQITAFLNKHHEELNASADEKLKNAKAALADATKARKTAEKELKELKESHLSDDEKLQKALEEAEASKADYAKKLNRLEVEKLFVDAGITSEYYEPIIDSVVTDDAEASKKLAGSFVDVMKSQKEATEKALREELSIAPKPHAAGGKDDDGGKPALTAAEQVAQKLAQQNSQNVKSAKSALSYYTGGSDEGN
nr:MAG TPA: minor structural protein [Caudoviricetes sp.]DAJ55855.1 MAG TPA: minor structural protein [Caudoviricetes sp.]